VQRAHPERLSFFRCVRSVVRQVGYSEEDTAAAAPRSKRPRPAVKKELKEQSEDSDEDIKAAADDATSNDGDNLRGGARSSKKIGAKANRSRSEPVGSSAKKTLRSKGAKASCIKCAKTAKDLAFLSWGVRVILPIAF
jgi:hypothetical protein